MHATFRGYWDYDGGGISYGYDSTTWTRGAVPGWARTTPPPVKIEVDACSSILTPWASGARSYTPTTTAVRSSSAGEAYESKGKVPYIEGPLGKVYHGFGVHDSLTSWRRSPKCPTPKLQNTDFLACVRNREPFALGRAQGTPQLHAREPGACALRLNRTLHFDPDKQLFVGDEAANWLIDQPMRTP